MGPAELIILAGVLIIVCVGLITVLIVVLLKPGE